MGIKERIVEWVGAVGREEYETAVNRAYESGFYDGNDDPSSGDIASGGYGYRTASGKGRRDPNVDPSQVLDTAWAQMQSSPIADRVLEVKRDHVVGDGVRPVAPNSEKLQALLGTFWSENKLERRHKEFTRQLFGFGEQILSIHVRESDGRVLLGYIDPGDCITVVPHPQNSMEQWAVKTGIDTVDGGIKLYRILRHSDRGQWVTAEQAKIEEWEHELLKANGLTAYTGTVLYESVNRVSNQARGVSDLAPVADWIDQADEVLFALGDREQFAGYFSFDVTLTGADEGKVGTRSKQLRNNPPSRGSVNVHNDSEAWEMWAPSLNQQGSIDTFRAILGFILGGVGLPVHWFGFGDDANRATAVAQGAPTERSLKHDQGVVHDMLMTVCELARDQAVAAGSLSLKDGEGEIVIDMPPISAVDVAAAAQTLVQASAALAEGVANGWITNETAAKAYHKLTSQLGVEIDTAAELEAVTKAQGDQAETEAAQANEALVQRFFVATNGDGRDE